MSKGFEVVVRPIKGTLQGKCFDVKNCTTQGLKNPSLKSLLAQNLFSVLRDIGPLGRAFKFEYLSEFQK
jgi:hypothetical protein